MVIYGGTIGGVTAAIQVARMGKSVILLEPGSHLGGMSVEGLGGTDIDNHKEFQNSPAVGGLALEFYRRIARAYGREQEFEKMLINKEKRPDLWRFESHVAEEVIMNWVNESKIKFFFNARLSERNAVKLDKDRKLTTIHLEDGRAVNAKIFIDATIEGDLLHAAGVSTTFGRESNSQYNETLNGIRAITDHAQFQVPVDPL